MLKNYFCELGSIFKDSGIFFKDNFKKISFLWLLILLQIVIGIPILQFLKTNIISVTPVPKFILLVGAQIIFLVIFFFMFKKIFNLASIGLLEAQITNGRIIKSLILLGIFNLIPFGLFLAFVTISGHFSQVEKYLQIILTIFTFLYYFAMCLSVASIVKWQNKNIICAIWNGIKVFFKKILYVAPVFLVMLILSTALVFLICTLIYLALIYLNVLEETMVDTIHAVVNTYSLYIIAGLYIGMQTSVLKQIKD